MLKTHHVVNYVLDVVFLASPGRNQLYFCPIFAK